MSTYEYELLSDEENEMTQDFICSTKDSLDNSDIHIQFKNLTVEQFERIMNPLEEPEEDDTKDDTMSFVKSQIPQKKFYVSLTGKRRGRQAVTEFENSNKKRVIHDKCASDNLKRKIQVHYLSFIISSLNDVLHQLGYSQKFLKINYKFKKNVNNKFFEQLKAKSLSEIITNPISDKYSTKLSNLNQNIYDQLQNEALLKNLLNENYLNYFKFAYFNSSRKFNLKPYGLNKDIFFSEKTKVFQDLIHGINSDYAQQLNSCVIEHYLPDYIFYLKKNL